MTFHSAVDLGCQVTGVVRLGKKFYSLSTYGNMRSAILVDDSALVEQRSVSIYELHNPRDIAGCELCQFLYIADGTGDVWRVNVTDGFTVGMFVRHGNAFTLSMASQYGRLTITEFFIYNPDGRPSSVSDLSKFDRTRTFHAIEYPQPNGGGWIFAQLVFADGSTFERVAKTNRSLYVQRSFGSPEYLINPSYLSLDKDTGHVFAVDRERSQVLVFDSELTHYRILLTSANSSLSRVNFDSVSGLLFVVDSSDVKAFRVCNWVLCHRQLNVAE